MKTKSVRTKCIVQPTEAVTMLNLATLETIHSHRPSLVVFTAFIEERLADGSLKVLARALPMEAEDLEFLDCYNECEKNSEYAIDAYCGEFNLDRTGEALDGRKPAGTRLPRRKRRTAEEMKKDLILPPPPADTTKKEGQ